MHMSGHNFENRKIRHENEILKTNEPAPYEQKLKIYRMTQKHTTKSRETILVKHDNFN
jgi:hypothetical protein